MDRESKMNKPTTRWHKIKAWFAARKVAFISYGLIVAMLVLFLWPSAVISIYPGDVGVLYSRLFGGTVMDRVYGEGIHLILPWDTMYIYSVRLQQESVEIPVLSRGGLTVDMRLSVYFYPIYDRLPELHKEIGPLYKEKLILPIITASIRNTVGGYWPEDLYTSAPLKLQDEIMVQAVEQMARKPVIIDSLVVRGITLPKQVNEAIDLKFSAEQEYLRYKYVLLKAGEQLKERYIQAESVRLFQQTVNQGLTENFLRWSGIEATKELAASPNTKFVIMGGGHDGLPVILNTDTQTPSTAKPSSPAAAKPQAPSANQPAPSSTDTASISPQTIDQVNAAADGKFPNWKSFMDKYHSVENALKQFNDMIHQGIIAEPGRSPEASTRENR